MDNYKCLKPLSTEPNVWLPELKLSQSDKEVLLCPTGWLTDNIMNAAQHLLQNKFPNLEGLQDWCGVQFHCYITRENLCR